MIICDLCRAPVPRNSNCGFSDLFNGVAYRYDLCPACRDHDFTEGEKRTVAENVVEYAKIPANVGKWKTSLPKEGL